MTREDIASNALRELVVGLKTTGLPEPFQSEEEARAELSDEQLQAFVTFYGAVEAYNEIAKGQEGNPDEGTLWWNAVVELRKQLQIVVEAGVIRMSMVQRLVFDYGALPDPEVDWKYYRLPSGVYACWECGTGILQKDVANSVWHKEMRGCAGSGEVRHQMIPYCPTCDREPTDGVIMESLQEALARDHVFARLARQTE